MPALVPGSLLFRLISPSPLSEDYGPRSRPWQPDFKSLQLQHRICFGQICHSEAFTGAKSRLPFVKNAPCLERKDVDVEPSGREGNIFRRFCRDGAPYPAPGFFRVGEVTAGSLTSFSDLSLTSRSLCLRHLAIVPVQIFIYIHLLLPVAPSAAYAEANPSRVVAPHTISYSPVSKEERRASMELESRIATAVMDLEAGQQAQAEGSYTDALNCFSKVIRENGDLALAEYARVGWALVSYEVGDRGDAIVQMEDLSITLRGYPEIHAALAAALYADKHAVMAAEKQFTIATLLDRRYNDVEWVGRARHWPPSLVLSLHKFLSLS